MTTKQIVWSVVGVILVLFWFFPGEMLGGSFLLSGALIFIGIPAIFIGGLVILIRSAFPPKE